METPERLSFQRLSVSSPSTPQSSSASRLWRPAAQRNLRNQWSKLVACRQRWAAAASRGRPQATSLVNAYLSQIYMPNMKLGALSDFPDIREKASRKLFRQQELHRSKLVLTYRDLISVVLEMVDISRSMRCYSKGATSSPIAQFSNSSDAGDDAGDGGGVAIFRYWSIPEFELLAEELIQMFKSELDVKRKLMIELLSISSQKDQVSEPVSWSCELYLGEFEDLRRCNIDLTRIYELSLSNCQSSSHKTAKISGESASKVLEVYLTIWLAEVNIDVDRLEEILNLIGSEMQVNLK
ncbi:unnamed protein product [Rhodiola kirilowii]